MLCEVVSAEGHNTFVNEYLVQQSFLVLTKEQNAKILTAMTSSMDLWKCLIELILFIYFLNLCVEKKTNRKNMLFPAELAQGIKCPFYVTHANYLFCFFSA